MEVFHLQLEHFLIYSIAVISCSIRKFIGQKTDDGWLEEGEAVKWGKYNTKTVNWFERAISPKRFGMFGVR